MTRVTKGLCLYKNSDSKGLSTPTPGPIYRYKNMKKLCIKSNFKDMFFETCNKWAKWHGFSVDIRILSTKGCLPLPWDYINVEKHWKCVWNQNSKRFVWNLQQMVEVIKAFCWHQMFVPKGFSALAPGLYTCIKSLKMCIKSDFEETILKLATYEQREKTFLLSSKRCPQWIVCPCPGLYTYDETWKKKCI